MSFARRCLPFAVVGAASAWMAFANTGTGDFPVDAGAAIHALTHGHSSQFFSIHATGPFAILLEASFALLGRGSALAEYQWACFPCLLAAGFLGLYLAAMARRRGVSALSGCAIAMLCLVNPLTLEALQSGHPEEMLTAALAVAAVAVASEGYDRRAAVLLGLAIASKQWAVIAILPVLMAVPARRVRTALITAAVALAFILPIVAAGPGSYSGGQANLTSTSGIVDPWNIWYPAATVTTIKLPAGDSYLTAHPHRATIVAQLSHPLIVLLAIALPLALALRRRRFGLSGPDAMTLFALLALLRCALDPVGTLYYHEPLLLALIGWDAMTCRNWPLRGLAGAAIAALFWRWSLDLSDPQALNIAYIVMAVGVGGVIAVALFRRARSRPVAVAATRFGGGIVAGRSYG
ncbi:MAG TPA: glycosyltransferase family 87 protein [Solirubrobacterales bacterium]